MLATPLRTQRGAIGRCGAIAVVMVGLFSVAPAAAAGRAAETQDPPAPIQLSVVKCPPPIRPKPPTDATGASSRSDPAVEPCAPPDAGMNPARQPAHQEHTPPQQPPGEREYPSLHISGFSDINYAARHRLEGSRGFSEGQFALHLASELSPRVTFFGELSLTARSDAGTGPPASPAVTGFNAEVERSIIRFDQSDLLKVSFGRYHTPINWWNTAFHHGQWLQTTITRPEMIQFGGRFLPVHFIGGLAEGVLPARGWNFNYKAGIGNGRASVISRGGDAGDSNGNSAWLLNGFVKPDRAFGLQIGGSVYFDKITLASAREFRERIVAAHVVWQKEDPELIAEVAGVRHREIPDASPRSSHAFYIQAAYRLPWARKLWKPYYRFERIDINSTDVVFQGVPELNGSTLGVRYDLSMYAAVKSEYRIWRRDPGSPRNYGGFFQICFTF